MNVFTTRYGYESRTRFMIAKASSASFHMGAICFRRGNTFLMTTIESASGNAKPKFSAFFSITRGRAGFLFIYDSFTAKYMHFVGHFSNLYFFG
jgi:hypothetical protein